MLGLQIAAPEYLIFKLVVILLKKFNGFRISNASELGVCHMVQSLDQALVDEIVKECHFFGRIFQNIINNVLDHALSDHHVIL